MLASNLRRFKVITFDCTNTILFFKNPPEVQYVKTAAEHGFSPEGFDKDLVKLNFRKQFKELQTKYPNFGKDSISYDKWWKKLVINVLTQASREKVVDSKLLEPVAERLIVQYKTKECWGKFEKSNELIDAMKAAGKTVGIISNFDPRLHDLLKDVGLPKFDFVVTSYEAGTEKPNHGIFKYAAQLSRQTFKPCEGLHIGNELKRDYEGAKEAGWASVLVNADSKSQPAFKNIEDLWNMITTREIKL